MIPLGRRLAAFSSLDVRFALGGLVDATGTGCYLAASAVFFSRKVGLAPTMIGIGLTLSGALGFATTVPWGRAADRWGCKRVLVLLQCVRALAFALYPLVASLPAFLAVSALLGLADKATPPIQQALIGETVGEERRQRTLAVVRSTRNVGFALGSLLAAAAISSGTTLAYDSIVLLNAASFVLVAVLMATLRVTRHVTPTSAAASGRGGWRLHDPRYTRLTIMNGVLTLHMALLSVGLPLWLLRRTAVSPAMIPMLLLLNAVLAVLFQVLVADRVHSPRSAALALSAAGVALAVCCLTMPLAAMLPATGACVVAAGGVLSLTVAELAQSAGGWELSYAFAPSQRRAQYLGALSLGTTAQTMVGPVLLTGVVFSLGTLGWALLAAITLATGMLVPIAVRRWQHHTELIAVDVPAEVPRCPTRHVVTSQPIQEITCLTSTSSTFPSN